MASGDSLAFWDALSSRPPGGGAATIAGVNNDVVLSFHPDDDKLTYFSGILPESYGGGDIEVHLYHQTESGADDIKVDVAFERRQPGVYDFDNGEDFGTATSVLITATDPDLMFESTAVITAANAGTPLAGEPYRFSVMRDADDVTDTNTGLWNLIAVKLLEA